MVVLRKVLHGCFFSDRSSSRQGQVLYNDLGTLCFGLTCHIISMWSQKAECMFNLCTLSCFSCPGCSHAPAFPCTSLVFNSLVVSQRHLLGIGTINVSACCHVTSPWLLVLRRLTRAPHKRVQNAFTGCVPRDHDREVVRPTCVHSG